MSEQYAYSQGSAAALDYAKPPNGARGWWFYLLVVAGSLGVPGSGHIWTGRALRGRILVVIHLVLLATAATLVASPPHFIMGLVLFLVAFALCVGAAIDVVRRDLRAPLDVAVRPRWLFVGTVLALALNPLVVGWLYVHSVYDFYVMWNPSMSPTLQAGDYFASHRLLVPRRWDVVVVEAPWNRGVPTPRRLVGMANEQVVLRDGQLLINGAVSVPPAGIKLNDAEAPWGPLHGHQTRPARNGPGEIFVLGELSNSLDSRHSNEALRESNVSGVVTFVYWPPSRWGAVDRGPR